MVTQVTINNVLFCPCYHISTTVILKLTFLISLISHIVAGDHIGGTVNNPNINIQDIDKRDAGSYTCVLTNGAGDGESQPVMLEVLCK